MSFIVIAKVFRQADTEETGTVDSSRIIELALAVLGQTAKDPEKQLVKYYANLRGSKTRLIDVTIDPVTLHVIVQGVV